MAVDINSEEGRLIRKLIPLATLPSSVFDSLCKVITVEEQSTGYTLFEKGDLTNEFVYLLDGEISLQAEKLEVEIISPDSQSALFPLAHQPRRKINAIAQSDIRFLRIAMELINSPTSVYNEEDSGYMVTDEPEEISDDWMTTLLKSPIFQQLPASNLQQILIGLKEIRYKKGDIIIEQGEPGDYYYLIRKGICLLTRRPSANARQIKLAKLGNNDTFGEDSLLSGQPRNVTITALTDMTMLRLDKDKFLTLIKEPIMHFIDYAEVPQELELGAMLLDVRTPDAYQKAHLEHSINTPFFSLRMQVKTLNRKRKAIVVCDEGKISEAAAFLLLKNKINAVILSGGIQQVPAEVLQHAASFDIQEDGSEIVLEPPPALAAEAETQSGHEQEAAKAPEKAVQPTGTDDTDPAPQMALLKTEIDALRRSCQQFKKQCEVLVKEKSQAEKKIQALLNQNNQLKALLCKLQPTQPE